jgi:hypothetical protein
MWRDYIGLLPATAAIINGFIAVIVAQFFKDHHKPKIVLVVMAGLLGVVAIGATFYAQHQIVVGKTAEEAKRAAIREELGVFISEGNDLMAECTDPNKPPPTDKANDWVRRTGVFLPSLLGTSCVTRFNDQTGTPPMRINGVNDAHQNLWRGIYYRVLRLEQFSEQLPP